MCVFLLGFFSHPNSHATTQYSPPEDAIAPTLVPISRSQNSVLGRSPDGNRFVMTTIVRVGSVYQDEGADSFDNKDGDLSHAVSTFGASAVSTRFPTSPSRPFLVLYNVQDAAGTINR